MEEMIKIVASMMNLNGDEKVELQNQRNAPQKRKLFGKLFRKNN